MGSSKIVRPRGDGRRSFTEYLILMEFCIGGTLHSFIENQIGSLSESRVLSIFLDVVRGIKALHTLKPPCCHRDLKVC